MEFLFGTVNSYVKGFEMENKWQTKKKSGDFKPEKKKSEIEQKNDQFKAFFKQQQELEKDKDKTLEKIQNKVNSGEKLTPEEMRYLQQKNPMLYDEVRKLENECKQYEKKLRSCKTKDEVKEAKMQKTGEILTKVSSIQNNPTIPKEQKFALIMHEQKRMNAIEKVTLKFVKSGEMEKLPTREEYRKAEDKIMDEKMCAAEEKNTEKSPEIAENKSNEMKSEIENDGSSKIAVTENESEQKSDNKCEAESDDVKKVKRARAKSRYNQTKQTTQPAAMELNFTEQTAII